MTVRRATGSPQAHRRSLPTSASQQTSTPTPLIDIHGDLHVGQVLRHSAPPAYAITDFDGNPVVRVDEHDDRQPAAVDVTGMAASLDHVGRVVLRRGDDSIAAGC